MFISLVCIGIKENKNLNDYKLILKEKNGQKRLFINISSDLSGQIKFILGKNNYNGIYDIFLTIVEKFGFILKKTIIELKNDKATLFFYDEYGNNFSIYTSIVDSIILSTYKDSIIYIDETEFKMSKCKNSSTLYSSFDLAKYTTEELYNMLERAKYDDNFLEEAVRIREEIKLRESKNIKIYDENNDIPY